MKTPRALSKLVWATLALGAAGQTGCAPADGCQDFADCDPGQVCAKDGTCVADPGGGGVVDGDGGTGDEDGGGNTDGGPNDGGPRVDEARLTTDEEVVSLQRDPRPGRAGMLLVAERGVSFDRVSELDPAGDALGDIVFDFAEDIAPTESCGMDAVRFEGEPNIAAATVDELWFTCTEGDPWRIRYTDDLTAPGVDEATVVPDLVARFPADSQGNQHALVAQRGSDALYSVLFPESPTSREEPRLLTPVTTVTFGAIAQVFTLTPDASGTAQDYAAVFDRGGAAGGPRLIALQRDDTEEVWTLNVDLGAGGVRVLPPGTTAVAIVGPVDTSGVDTPLAANLVAFVPAEGRAYYTVWEQEGLNDDEIVYEATASFRGDVPPPEDKIFLAAVDDAGIFFATTTSWHAWRLPFDPIDDGDVLSVAFDQDTDLPTGMVPFDATFVWFSFRGEDEQLRRLELIP